MKSGGRGLCSTLSEARKRSERPNEKPLKPDKQIRADERTIRCHNYINRRGGTVLRMERERERREKEGRRERGRERRREREGER